MIALCFALLLQEDLLKDGDAVAPVDKWFSESRVKKEDARRIMDGDAWKAFWAEHKESKTDKAPAVDFTKHMVLVFPRPMAFGCVPPELTSIDIRETKDALRVIPTIKPGGCNNEMHGHPMMMGKVAVVIVVPRSAKRVDFVEKRKAGAPTIARTLDAMKD
jgi:hypothetical protein